MLSFADQIRLFSQRRVISGMVGSAFHTAIFAPPLSKIICLVPGGQINSNMILMDEVGGAHISYYSPLNGITRLRTDDRFGDLINLNEVEKVAQEFADLVFAETICRP